MAANAVPFRSTIFYTTAGVPASAGSILTVGANGTQNFTNNVTLNTLTASTISMQSTTIALGQSTNQRYTNFTSGSFASSLMTSTLTSYNSLSTVTKVSMSQDGRYQYALQSAPSTLSYYQLARSSDTGVTWNTLNTSTMGLPQGSLAYQSTVSGYPTYSNISQSATGQYALASVSGGQLYVSNNANSATPVYTPANVGGSPTVYLPFDALPITDMMGNSAITVTGSAPLVAGKVGTSAINLANTAGGTATNYVRGSWTGAANFTVSFWFNAQSLASYTNLFSTYNANVTLYILPSPFYIALYVGTTNIASTTSILTNRWYNVTAIYQNGGTCSLYLNGSLVASGTASWNPNLLSGYALGTSVVDQVYTLNGYIDDFRLYNFAAPNVVSPYIYLPLDGNTTDAMGNTTITTTGSPGYVFGAPVGTRALSLANTAGGTATQYIRGSWTAPTSCTISFWFQPRTISGVYQYIFTTYSTAISVFISNTNIINCVFPTGTTMGQTLISTTYTASVNTWYNATLIFVGGGTCSFYVNNVLVGTSTNSGGFGTFTSNATFGLGTYDNAQNNCFNGYIDDFKIYNYAVTPSPIAPLNWSHTAVSATGQYMMAACNSGGIFCSSNYGASWSQLTATQISSLVPTGGSAKTLMGPIMQPNNAAATSANWSANGVAWTASASTTLPGGYDAFKAFDTANGNGWHTNTGGVYNTSGNTSGIYTTIQGIGSIQGDWLQIQSSVPLVIYSYQFATGFVVANLARIPKNFYIVGSNDGTNWYPIQNAVGGSNPSSTSYTTIASTISVTSTASQTFGSGTIVASTYSTTTNSYIYFRLIATSIYTSIVDYIDMGEWYVNFSTPMPLLTAPATAPSTATSAVTVSPTMTNLAAANWSTPNGVTWTVSASTTISTFFPYKAFDNTLLSSWNNTSQTYTTTGNTSGVNTTASGIAGQITGDYIQLQSSVPLVINSYQLATGGGNLQIPSTFYIVGSNDNSTWFAIQKCVASRVDVPPAIASTLIAGTITVATAGSQTFGNMSLTTTTYSTTTNAYIYFRIIGTATFGTNTYLEIGGWDVNFTAYTPNPVNALAISNGGQNMLVAATGTTMPNVVGVTPAAITTWTANGVTWTASGLYLSSPYFPYYAFNNSLGPNSWASSSLIYTTTPLTSGTTTSVSGIGTVYGDYLQLQSSVPIVMYSYQFATGSDAAIYFVKTFYIVGSNDGSTWYPIQYGNANSTQPTSSIATLIQNMIYVNSAGAQPFGNSILTTTTYSTTTNAYTYFRLIPTATFNSSANVVQIGEWYTHFQLGATYISTNYGSTWSTATITPQNAPFLATSGNGQYTITGISQSANIYSNATLTTYTTPTLTGINANINCASVSSTGQYMIILTQGTTNNVFYSTNYGVTFTGMTVGTLPMTSCAISYDGFEITVSNAANVYTLNRNTQGYAITMGNQSGVANQGYNSVAIGNLAGVTNQSANSIILNASGSALDAYNPGFFVSPVQSQATSNQSSVGLLGYGADGQVVQTAMSVRADGTFNPFNVNNTGNVGFAGNVGFGTTVPTAPLHLNAPASTVWPFLMTYSSGPQLVIGNSGTSNIALDTYNTVTGSRPAICLNPSGGFVGIGKAVPTQSLHVRTFTGYSSTAQTVAYFETAQSAINKEQTFYISLCLNDASGGSAAGSYTSIGSVIPALASTSLVLQEFGGNVGIGTKNPRVPLHVVGTSSIVTSTAYSYFAPNTGIISSLPGPGTFYASIYAADGIVSAAHVASVTFSSFSDVRIKKNIETYPSNILDLLLQFRVVSYDHIDFKNGHVKAGLVAQEVEQIVPSCVNRRAEYIPNIYSLGTHSLDGDNVVITVVDANGVPKDVSGVEIGAARKISLKLLKNGTTEHDVNEEIITQTSTQFTVRKWENYCADDKVFVYGTEVDDFRVLDKDVISMMGIKAIQELAGKVTSQASQIQELASQTALLSAENTQLKLQLAALEARLAAAGF